MVLVLDVHLRVEEPVEAEVVVQRRSDYVGANALPGGDDVLKGWSLEQRALLGRRLRRPFGPDCQRMDSKTRQALHEPTWGLYHARKS